jgi:hypothetical protein
LSKALLLAADRKITDPTITRQIGISDTKTDGDRLRN